MEELTLRDYPIGVLENLIGTKGKQATDRKLKNYGYGFSNDDGTGRNRIYTITSLPNSLMRLKSYCVFSLGFAPNTEISKLRDFVFFLFTDDDFNWRPDEMMEEYMRANGKGLSRATIAKYKRTLEKNDLIDTCFGDFVYYKVFKRYGVQEHEIITKEEYSQAWRWYWERRRKNPDEDSRPAYAYMYNKFGGVPRKQRRVSMATFAYKQRETLLNLVISSILEEVSDE